MKVRLKGYVMNDSSARMYRRYGYTDVCCPGDIREALSKCPEGEDLELEINSGGGSVYQGFEMYSALRDSGRKNIIGNIQGIAGSAMSVVACGCNKVVMSPVANFMIHRSSTSASGNAQVHDQTSQMLTTIDKSLMKAYTEKTAGKCSVGKIVQMMRDETYLTAEEAVQFGFADEISQRADPDSAVASAYNMPGLFGLPPIEDLKAMDAEVNAENNAGDERDEADAATGGDAAPAAETDVENTTHDEQEENMEQNKIETAEQLAEAYPDLVNQIKAAAASEGGEYERARIADIEAQAMPGFEDIVEAAKADGSKNGDTVAKEIIARMKEQGNDYLQGVKDDIKDSKAGEVEGADTDTDQGAMTEEQEAEAIAKEVAAQWKKGK